MRKPLGKKGYVIAGIIIILLFILMSLFAVMSILRTQGQARVVNYVGIVRGATQKLVKEEMYNVHDDKLIERLNSIIDNLLTGKGEHNLILLPDEHYLDLLDRVQILWNELKVEISRVRQGGDSQKLFDTSQEYFELVNETVFAAEEYSESQIRNMMNLLLSIDAGLIILIIIGGVSTIKGVAFAKNAKILGRIAYIDPMTQIDNRSSCERLIESINTETSAHDDMAVAMFDMNNLKTVNDSLGHKSGDNAIIQFARILKETTEGYGFIGRYGGDEFIAIIRNTNLNAIEKYLEKIHEEVRNYNNRQTNDLQKLSFATGYCVGNLQTTSIDDMIYEADKKMYENKHEMKKGLKPVQF